MLSVEALQVAAELLRIDRAALELRFNQDAAASRDDCVRYNLPDFRRLVFEADFIKGGSVHG